MDADGLTILVKCDSISSGHSIKGVLFFVVLDWEERKIERVVKVFLRRKRKRNRRLNDIFLRDWELAFIIGEEEEGVRCFVDLVMFPMVETFRLPYMCKIYCAKNGIGDYKGTSWLKSFSVIYMEGRPLPHDYQWQNKGVKFVLMVRTESGSAYYLTDQNINEGFKAKLIYHGFPRDLLS